MSRTSGSFCGQFIHKSHNYSSAVGIQRHIVKRGKGACSYCSSGGCCGQKNAQACRTVMSCYPSTALSVHIRSEMVSREILSAISEKLLDLVIDLCRNLCRPPLCFRAYGVAWVSMSFKINFRMRDCFKGEEARPQSLRLHHR